ncbi:hypothetical protein IU450_36225 [Nocardia abscessus]|uniref:hypothetical protein n=1 Tax=Nocardia abscessus TaxID=120957 RepID=UPI001892E947|nr:hypothetical protein [Nocardia abscessus]MBF6341290.1 hypothetical protein [Nocardia abscessus]
MFENIAVIERAKATAYAYDIGPFLDAFEAVAFGEFWSKFGRHESREMQGALGRAYNSDKRYWVCWHAEGKKPDDGTAYQRVRAARALVELLPSVEADDSTKS